MVPKSSQNRPKIVPKWLRNRPPREIAMQTPISPLFWGVLGSSRDHLGRSWWHFGGKLGPSGSQVRAKLGQDGAKRGHLGRSWARLGRSWRYLGPSWAQHGSQNRRKNDANKQPNFRSIFRSIFYRSWMDFAAPEKQKIIDFILVFVVFLENRRFQVNNKI